MMFENKVGLYFKDDTKEVFLSSDNIVHIEEYVNLFRDYLKGVGFFEESISKYIEDF